jgi:hypothetical protein
LELLQRKDCSFESSLGFVSKLWKSLLPSEELGLKVLKKKGGGIIELFRRKYSFCKVFWVPQLCEAFSQAKKLGLSFEL